MVRASGIAVLLMFVGMLVAPFAVLVEFHVHRAQIEKELCVQRDVVDAMRTCHGECQLSKRFNALEQESQQEFPVERISVRSEPQVLVARAPIALFFTAEQRMFPSVDATLSNGFPPASEPVPWLA
ncbi:MAG: hypothetical protein WAR83_15385 [Flavobacteriales bacterium]|jgi:hypothetical protein